METKSFFRTFSYREVLSAVMLASVFLAIIRTLLYLEMPLANELMGFLILLIVIFLHVIYKREHKRSNTFAGRVIHDCIYLTLLFCLNQFFFWYEYGEFSFDFDTLLAIVVMLCIVVALFEGLISLLKRLLDFLKWRVL